MKIIRFLFLLTILLTVTNNAHALRPLETDDGTISKPGAFQFEAGVIYEAGHFGGNDNLSNFTLPFVLEYGLLPRFEVGLRVPIISNHPGRQGLLDLTGHLKYLIMEESIYFPGVATDLIIKFPTASTVNNLSTGEPDIQLNLILSQDIGMNKWFINAGYTKIGNPPDIHYDDVFNYGAAVTLPYNQKWNFLFEISGETNKDPAAKSDFLEIVGGLSYQTMPNVVYDFSLGFGLTSSSPDIKLGIGTTVEF